MPQGVGYPLSPLRPAVLAVSYLLPTPLYPLLGGATKALALWKSCLAVTENALYYHHCFKCKSKTQSYTSHCEENYPSNPVHSVLLTSHDLHHAVALHDLIESNWQPPSPPHPLIQYTDIIPLVYGHPLQKPLKCQRISIEYQVNSFQSPWAGGLSILLVTQDRIGEERCVVWYGDLERAQVKPLPHLHCLL